MLCYLLILNSDLTFHYKARRHEKVLILKIIKIIFAIFKLKYLMHLAFLFINLSIF